MIVWLSNLIKEESYFGIVRDMMIKPGLSFGKRTSVTVGFVIN